MNRVSYKFLTLLNPAEGGATESHLTGSDIY